ncbi:MAG: hypothetical protein ACFE8A_02440 [Candidatus Hodarchaeota archaeon]
MFFPGHTRIRPAGKSAEVGKLYLEAMKKFLIKSKKEENLSNI